MAEDAFSSIPAIMSIWTHWQKSFGATLRLDMAWHPLYVDLDLPKMRRSGWLSEDELVGSGG
jgi:hypothetical protein